MKDDGERSVVRLSKLCDEISSFKFPSKARLFRAIEDFKVV